MSDCVCGISFQKCSLTILFLIVLCCSENWPLAETIVPVVPTLNVSKLIHDNIGIVGPLVFIMLS